MLMPDLKWAQLVRAIWENAFCFGFLLRDLGSAWLKAVRVNMGL